jgi:hypothetical protein
MVDVSDALFVKGLSSTRFSAKRFYREGGKCRASIGSRSSFPRTLHVGCPNLAIANDTPANNYPPVRETSDGSDRTVTQIATQNLLNNRSNLDA